MLLIKKKINDFNIPLYALEAEQSVIGSLIFDNEKFDQVISYIAVNDFYNKSHRIIFNKMCYLYELGKPVDLITLSEYLNKSGELEIVGGFSYLSELSKNISSISNIFAYVEIVRERSIIREIINVINEISNFCYNSMGLSSEDLLDLAESKIFEISEKRLNNECGPKNVNTILNSTIICIEQMFKKSNNGITGISSGYFDLDKITSGFQKSDLIVIASRPSMGKTTFAMNLCENAAIIYNKPVLIFSLEMLSEQIMMRMLSSLSRVDHTKIRTGKLNDDDWIRLSSSIGFLLKKRNIYIDDSSRLTPTELRTRSRRLFREYGGLSLIMIDYLQLMRVPSLSENRTLEIAEISRSLKALAKELKIPIIALSQLNRSLEQRSDKRPINSDLRESGSIEQDADLIMFIYRDEIYNEDDNVKNVAEIIIGKQRNGPIGNIRLMFNGKFSRFDNYISIYDN